MLRACSQNPFKMILGQSCRGKSQHGTYNMRPIVLCFALLWLDWIHCGFRESMHACGYLSVNTLRPKQNGRHFPDDIFKCIFLNENVWILIKISLKFVPKGRISNILTVVPIMAWRRPGDKPLSEPVIVSLLTHICVTRPQWVNVVNLKDVCEITLYLIKTTVCIFLGVICWGMYVLLMSYSASYKAEFIFSDRP